MLEQHTSAEDDLPKPTLQDVFRSNLRRLRKERNLRQDELAMMARANGLAWTQETVAKLEAGRRELTLLEWFALMPALNVRAEELAKADGPVWMGHAQVEGAALRHLAMGDPGQLPGPGRGKQIASVIEVHGRAFWRKWDTLARRYGLRFSSASDADYVLSTRLIAAAHGDAERKTARRLGLDPEEISVASFALWGRSLTDERDRRLEREQGHGDEQARRGHITRRLQEELAEKIKRRTRVKGEKR